MHTWRQSAGSSKVVSMLWTHCSSRSNCPAPLYEILGLGKVQFLRYPQVGVLVGATVYTDGGRVGSAEIHDYPSEVTVFLWPGEEGVDLAPGSEWLVIKWA